MQGTEISCFFFPPFLFCSGGDLQLQGSEISLTKDFAIDDRTVHPPTAPSSSSSLLLPPPPSSSLFLPELNPKALNIAQSSQQHH